MTKIPSNNKKLRIGLIGLAAKPIPNIPNNICAPHTILEDLVHQLRDLGHQVTIFTGKDSQIETKHTSNLETVWNYIGAEDKNPISYTERKAELDLIYSTEAIKAYQSGQIDIINSHDIRFSPYLFKQASVPVLYTPHFSLKTRFNDYDQYRYQLMTDPIFGVTNISQENNDFCQNLDLKTYHRVPNGIPIEKYPFNASNRSGLLLVGRMVPGKMIKEAVEIAKNLDESITLIGPKGTKEGEGEFFEDLKANYFNQSHVNYVGFLEPEQIVEYYQKAKALIFPSQSEGLPLTILEAMATGLPVVASKVGGIPDIIDQGIDGCLVKNNNFEDWSKNIQTALSIDPKVVRQKIETKFTSQVMTQNYLQAYQEFIEFQKGVK